MPGRNHSRQFKLECVRQVATGQKRPAQLCREHNLAESALLRWRKECEARGEEASTEKRASSGEEALEARVAELERFRGKLPLESGLLKRGPPSAARTEARHDRLPQGEPS